ncbi:MAG: hypothetical protein JWQ70_1782, partial [Aeromicrobium sp.]|nr:hypothetical protein [Aeromicrobium sp.]
MLSRILWAARWVIPAAIVIGATQLPATAQTNDPIRKCVAADYRSVGQSVAHHHADNSLRCYDAATDDIGKLVVARPAPAANLARPHIVPPVYEMAA